MTKFNRNLACITSN